jgi:hypothetical protein
MGIIALKLDTDRHSAGHAKVSTFLKIIADAIGFENMQAAFDGAGDPSLGHTGAIPCREHFGAVGIAGADGDGQADAVNGADAVSLG